MTEKKRTRYRGKKAAAFSSLNAVLKANIRYSADGKKVISHATLDDRSQFFDKLVRDLHGLGYALSDIRNLKPKHIQVLATLWETQGLSSSTLQKRFAYLRLLCRWIGKPGMVGDARKYLQDSRRYAREYATKIDKSWATRGIDAEQVIAQVAEHDAHVAMQLRLQQQFGLRIQESWLLRPQLADHGTLLEVRWGTKGGRPRWVPIVTDTQRMVLDEAKTFTSSAGDSLIPKTYSLKQWVNRYHYICRRYGGLSRHNGITSHGLRHGYANDRYEVLTGEQTPVRAGDSFDATAWNRGKAERLLVSEELGHTRERITTAYYGKLRR